MKIIKYLITLILFSYVYRTKINAVVESVWEKEPVKSTVEKLTPDPKMSRCLISAKKNTDNPLKGLESCFWYAIRTENSDALTLLLETGVDPNIRNITGYTGLMVHAGGPHDNSAITELLLKAHADPNKQSLADGTTALLRAAEKGNIAIAQALLEHKAMVNQLDYYGNSPLLLAARNGKTEMVRVLLTKEPLINHQNQTGTTPLMAAVGNEHTDVVKILLQNNASTIVQNQAGETALMLAVQNDDQDTTNAILQVNDETRDGINSKGETALIIAAQNQSLPLISLLIKANANPFITDASGKGARDYIDDHDILNTFDQMITANETVHRALLKKNISTLL